MNFIRVSESEGEKKLLRQRSVVKKEEKATGKDTKPSDSHKLIEEEKAEIGSVRLEFHCYIL
jgi:hypothetical protein